MKNIYLIILFTCLIVTSVKAQSVITKEDVKALKKQLPKELTIKPDYIEHVIWIKTPEMFANGTVSPISTTTHDLTHQFYFKVTKNENGEWVINGLHYVIRYNAYNWLFIDSMMVLVAKTNKETRQGVGNKYVINFTKENEYRSVAPPIPISGGGLYVVKPATIYEEYDIYNNSQIIEWLKNIAETGNFTRLRIHGNKNYKDDTVFPGTLRPQAIAITTALNYSLFKIYE